MLERIPLDRDEALLSWPRRLLHSAPLVKGSASLRWRCVSMSRARLRELVVRFAIGSALTLAVFFLALWLLPYETFTPFPFPRFPGFF